MQAQDFIVVPNSGFELASRNPEEVSLPEEEGEALLRDNVRRLRHFQDRLFAQSRHAILVVIQALDAAGKDSLIKNVFSGLNPAGCQVSAFKAPSQEELSHDYLWRAHKALPERGKIGVFNRSYYEEVLVVRVHPRLLAAQRLPEGVNTLRIWEQRFEEINNFEKYLVDNGIVVVKVFLHVSREKQRERFLKRLSMPDKHWKFSLNDIKERESWRPYMEAYEEMLRNTSTPWAPWHVIPADQKWYARTVLSQILYERFDTLGLAYPDLTEEERQKIEEGRRLLSEGL